MTRKTKLLRIALATFASAIAINVLFCEWGFIPLALLGPRDQESIRALERGFGPNWEKEMAGELVPTEYFDKERMVIRIWSNARNGYFAIIVRKNWSNNIGKVFGGIFPGVLFLSALVICVRILYKRKNSSGASS